MPNKPPGTHVVFVTGAAGYVGAMLVEQFSKRPDVAKVVALDKEPMPELLSGNPKLRYLQANTVDGSWQSAVADESPDLVIHAAWQIRMLYGRPETTWAWNVDGSRAVFEFALRTPSVARLIHFSTASVYGAYAENTFEHLITENEAMREREYLYGAEKRKVEEILGELLRDSARGLKTAVLRPAAITGPRGRFVRIRFGLQSALSGQLTGGVYGLVSALVARVPATRGWVRQFVHEDDVVDAVELLSFDPWRGSAYEVFNLAPPGAPVYAQDMAKAVGKKILPVSPALVRIAYVLFWHLTRGTIPTAPGSWRFYSFPIVMDGRKIMHLWDFRYHADSRTAFASTEGRWESSVPREARTRA